MEKGTNDTRIDPAIVRLCLGVLRRQPAGLLTDIDGTISPYAPTPAEATIADETRDALRRLAQELTLVGVITGRAAEAGEHLVGLPELIYVGNHGTERRHHGQVWHHPGALATSAQVTAALNEIVAGARDQGLTEGLVVEDKKLSGSIHYRLTADPKKAQEILLPLAEAAAKSHELVVTEGRLIVELRPPLAVNKGTAVADLAREHHLRGLIFLGDDLTDVDGFRTLRELRGSGEIDTLAVAAVTKETAAEVLNSSDVTVDGVSGCVALLAQLATALAAPVQE